MKKELVFTCSKCGHNLYIKKLTEKLIETNCRNCGEEGFENWIFSGLGNFYIDFPNEI